MNKLNDYIFYSDLKAELSFFLKNLEKLPSPLCFHGAPGNGKTSFARFLSSKAANATEYFDMNERKTNGTSTGGMLADIKYRASVPALFGTGGIWKRAIILDEWHDLTLNEQNAYKIPLEQYSENNRTLFILCVNTDEENTIDKVLSPAILSRCYCLSFDTPEDQYTKVKQKIARKYPDLPRSIINAKFPDMRQIGKALKLVA